MPGDVPEPCKATSSQGLCLGDAAHAEHFRAPGLLCLAVGERGRPRPVCGAHGAPHAWSGARGGAPTWDWTLPRPTLAAHVGFQTGDRGAGFGLPGRGTSLGEKKGAKGRPIGQFAESATPTFWTGQHFLIDHEISFWAGRGGQGWSGLACTARSSQAIGERFTYALRALSGGFNSGAFNFGGTCPVAIF